MYIYIYIYIYKRIISSPQAAAAGAAKQQRENIEVRPGLRRSRLAIGTLPA